MEYTLAEIRNRTGWPKGTRFRLIESGAREEAISWLREIAEEELFYRGVMAVDEALDRVELIWNDWAESTRE